MELRPRSHKDHIIPHNANHQVIKMNEHADTIQLLKILQTDYFSFSLRPVLGSIYLALAAVCLES